MSVLRIVAIVLGLFVAGSLVVTPVTLATACVAAEAVIPDDYEGQPADALTSDGLPGDPCNTATERGDDESAHVVPWIPTEAVLGESLVADSHRAGAHMWQVTTLAAPFVGPGDAPPPRA